MDKDLRIEDVARILDRLVAGLGFGNGYVDQGGDINCLPRPSCSDLCAERLLAYRHDSEMFENEEQLLAEVSRRDRRLSNPNGLALMLS